MLLTVAEAGSFRKATAQLDIGQSAVTRRVQKLEDALGVSLFERRRSGARLTNAGLSFISRARTIIDDLYAAMEHAQSAGVADNGHLRIGLIASLSRGVARDVVAGFLDQHPGVDLCFVEAERGELLTHLSHRVIDLVIAAGEPSYGNGDGLLLVNERIYLAVPQAGTLAERSQLSWGEVADAVFLVSCREPGPEIHDYIIRRVSDLGFTRASDRVLSTVSDGLSDFVPALLPGFQSNVEDRGETRRAEELAPMVIDSVFESGIARLVRAGLAFEHNRTTVRHY